MIGGFGASLVVFAVGAVLDFAVANPYQHGFDLKTVGVILMIVGAVGAVISLMTLAFWGGGWRRRRTVVEDSNGNVVRREDTYS